MSSSPVLAPLTYDTVFHMFGLDPTRELNADDMRRAKKQMLHMHPDKSRLGTDQFLHYKAAYDKLVRLYSATERNQQVNTYTDTLRSLQTTEEKKRYTEDFMETYYSKSANDPLGRSPEMQETFNSVYDKMKDMKGSAFQDEFNAMFNEYQNQDATRRKLREREQRRYNFMRSDNPVAAVGTTPATAGDTVLDYRTRTAMNTRDALQQMKDVRSTYYEPSHKHVTTGNLNQQFQDVLRQKHVQQQQQQQQRRGGKSDAEGMSSALTRTDYVPYMARASVGYSSFYDDDHGSDSEEEEHEEVGESRQGSRHGGGSSQALQVRPKQYYSHGVGGRANDLMYDDLRRVYRDGGALCSMPDDPSLLPPQRTVEDLKKEREMGYGKILSKKEAQLQLDREMEEARILNSRRNMQLYNNMEQTGQHIVSAMRSHMRLTL